MLTETLSSHSLLTLSRTSDELAMVTQKLSSNQTIYAKKILSKNQATKISHLQKAIYTEFLTIVGVTTVHGRKWQMTKMQD
jgi:hypothetical protein